MGEKGSRCEYFQPARLIFRGPSFEIGSMLCRRRVQRENEPAPDAGHDQQLAVRVVLTTSNLAPSRGRVAAACYFL